MDESKSLKNIKIMPITYCNIMQYKNDSTKSMFVEALNLIRAF